MRTRLERRSRCFQFGFTSIAVAAWPIGAFRIGYPLRGLRGQSGAGATASSNGTKNNRQPLSGAESQAGETRGGFPRYCEKKLNWEDCQSRCCGGATKQLVRRERASAQSARIRAPTPNPRIYVRPRTIRAPEPVGDGLTRAPSEVGATGVR